MIEVKNLFHLCGRDDVYAVEDVSSSIDKGEITGFLGPSVGFERPSVFKNTGLDNLKSHATFYQASQLSKRSLSRSPA